MKRLILIIAFALMPLFVFANNPGIISIKGIYVNTIPWTVDVSTPYVIFGEVCISGYKFAFMKAHGNDSPVSMVQIFMSVTGNPQPVKCEK